MCQRRTATAHGANHGRWACSLNRRAWRLPRSRRRHQVARCPPSQNAEAICEAVTRPTMRFVTIKTEEQQVTLMLHKTRDLLVRQRTMLTNALRAHLAEYGIVSAQGVGGPRKVMISRTTQLAPPSSGPNYHAGALQVYPPHPETKFVRRPPR
jgi:transposase